MSCLRNHIVATDVAYFCLTFHLFLTWLDAYWPSSMQFVIVVIDSPRDLSVQQLREAGDVPLSLSLNSNGTDRQPPCASSMVQHVRLTHNQLASNHD